MRNKLLSVTKWYSKAVESREEGRVPPGTDFPPSFSSSSSSSSSTSSSAGPLYLSSGEHTSGRGGLEIELGAAGAVGARRGNDSSVDLEWGSYRVRSGDRSGSDYRRGYRDGHRQSHTERESGDRTGLRRGWSRLSSTEQKKQEEEEGEGKGEGEEKLPQTLFETVSNPVVDLLIDSQKKFCIVCHENFYYESLKFKSYSFTEKL